MRETCARQMVLQRVLQESQEAGEIRAHGPTCGDLRGKETRQGLVATPFSFVIHTDSCGGGRDWSKARDLGSRPVGVRGFKSLPPHHRSKMAGAFNKFTKTSINFKKQGETFNKGFDYE